MSFYSVFSAEPSAAGAASASLGASLDEPGAASCGSASEEVQRVCNHQYGCHLEKISGTHQVVSQQLHDQCRVLVALLAESVKFGDGIIESLLGEMASLIGGVQDLIVEDREIQGEAKTNGVSRSKVS